MPPFWVEDWGGIYATTAAWLSRRGAESVTHGLTNGLQTHLGRRCRRTARTVHNLLVHAGSCRDALCYNNFREAPPPTQLASWNCGTVLRLRVHRPRLRQGRGRSERARFELGASRAAEGSPLAAALLCARRRALSLVGLLCGCARRARRATVLKPT